METDNVLLPLHRTTRVLWRVYGLHGSTEDASAQARATGGASHRCTFSVYESSLDEKASGFTDVAFGNGGTA